MELIEKKKKKFRRLESSRRLFLKVWVPREWQEKAAGFPSQDTAQPCPAS